MSRSRSFLFNTEIPPYVTAFHPWPALPSSCESKVALWALAGMGRSGLPQLVASAGGADPALYERVGNVRGGFNAVRHQSWLDRAHKSEPPSCNYQAEGQAKLSNADCIGSTISFDTTPFGSNRCRLVWSRYTNGSFASEESTARI